MNEQPSRSGISRGTLAVVVIVTIGLVLAFVAYGWWSMQAEAMRGMAERPTAESDQTALEELSAIATLFEEAIAEKKPVEPMLAPAQRLVEKYPDFAEARTLLGQILRVQGRLAESIEQLEMSLKLNPQQPNLHEMAGQIELERGELDRAAHHYRQAISLRPEDTRYRLFLAQVQLTQKDYDGARKTLLQALSINSSEHKAYAMLSDLYARQNKLELALDQIQKAIENTPILERELQVQYIRNRSMLLRRANRPEEALLALESLTPKERANLAVLADMATCWGMMGQPREAALMYAEAYQNNPADYYMLEKSAEWWIRANDREQAEKFINRLRRFTPQSNALAELEKKLAQMPAEQ